MRFKIFSFFLFGMVILTQNAYSRLNLYSGEEIVYDVELAGVKIGKATLKSVGDSHLQGRSVEVFLFVVDVLNFYDKEKIYADSYTGYPLRVERLLKIWGRKQKIFEDYNQRNYSLRITRNKKKTDKIIRYEQPIQNIILIIYAYRKKPIKVGQIHNFQLPTRRINIKVLRKEKLSIFEKEVETYLLFSKSPRIKIWIETRGKKRPLKIEGLLPLGKLKMIITESNYE